MPAFLARRIGDSRGARARVRLTARVPRRACQARRRRGGLRTTPSATLARRMAVAETPELEQCPRRARAGARRARAGAGRRAPRPRRARPARHRRHGQEHAPRRRRGAGRGAWGSPSSTAAPPSTSATCRSPSPSTCWTTRSPARGSPGSARSSSPTCGAVLPSVTAAAAGVVEGGPLERPRYHRALRSRDRGARPGAPAAAGVRRRPLGRRRLGRAAAAPAAPSAAHAASARDRAATRAPSPTGSRPRCATCRAATAVELGPLDAGEADRLLAGVSDPARRAAIVAESGGNPFFLKELASVAVPGDAGRRRRPPGELPPPVAAAVAVEVDRLPEPARELARGAAVVGEPFELELAAVAAGLDPAAATPRRSTACARRTSSRPTGRCASSASAIRSSGARSTTRPRRVAARGAPARGRVARRPRSARGGARPPRRGRGRPGRRGGDRAAHARRRRDARARPERRAALVPGGAAARPGRRPERTDAARAVARARAAGTGHLDTRSPDLEEALAGLGPDDGPRALSAAARARRRRAPPRPAARRLRAPAGRARADPARGARHPRGARDRAGDQRAVPPRRRRPARADRARARAPRASSTTRSCSTSVGGLHAVSLFYAGRPHEAPTALAETGEVIAADARRPLRRAPRGALPRGRRRDRHRRLRARARRSWTTVCASAARPARTSSSCPLLVFRCMAHQQTGRITEATPPPTPPRTRRGWPAPRTRCTGRCGCAPSSPRWRATCRPRSGSARRAPRSPTAWTGRPSRRSGAATSRRCG